jgi:hypothetical protein
MTANRIMGALSIITVAAASNLRAADDGSELVATWQSTSDGLLQLWTIKQNKGEYSVEGVYMKSDKEVGSFQGKNCKFADGKLSFIQEFKVKPVASWDSGSEVTVMNWNWLVATREKVVRIIARLPHLPASRQVTMTSSESFRRRCPNRRPCRPAEMPRRKPCPNDP